MSQFTNLKMKMKLFNSILRKSYVVLMPVLLSNN